MDAQSLPLYFMCDKFGWPVTTHSQSCLPLNIMRGKLFGWLTILPLIDVLDRYGWLRRYASLYQFVLDKFGWLRVAPLCYSIVLDKFGWPSWCLCQRCFSF